MKILVVFPKLHRQGGTERVLVEEINRFPSDWVVTLAASACEPGVIKRDINMIRISDMGLPGILGYLYFFLISSLWIAASRCLGKRYDLIYSPGIYCFGVTVSMSHYARRFFDIQDDWVPGRGFGKWLRVIHRSLSNAISYVIEWCGYRYVRKIICVSDLLARNMRIFYGLHHRQMAVIYNGVDSAEFSPTSMARIGSGVRAKYHLDSRVPVILFIGNGLARKGFPQLVKALSMKKDEAFMLAAVTNDYVEAYRQIPWIRFLPRGNNVLEYYGMADIFALPSVFDSCPLPVLEAMACGIPVVVGRGAGIAEVLNDGIDAMIISNPQDPDDILNRINQTLHDQPLRERLSKTGRLKAESLTWDHHSEELARVMRSVIGNHHDR